MYDSRTLRRGFTLIELLVVIAIIALLAAILFPVFARARENGRRASCQSNLKQIGLGLLQYSQDFDEYLVPATQSGGWTRTGPRWMDLVQPYVKSTQIFTCPSDSLPDGTYTYPSGVTVDTSVSSTYVTGTNLFGSYTINAYDYYYSSGSCGGSPSYPSNVSGPGYFPCRPPVNHSAVPLPATTYWVFENADGGVSRAGGDDISKYYAAPAAGQSGVNTAVIKTDESVKVLWSTANLDGLSNLRFVAARHLDTSNVLFCDGHVKALTLNALIADKTAGGVLRNWTIADD